MEWTPVPIASFLLLHFGPLANPAARLGALALLMLLGGAAGAFAPTIGPKVARALVATILFSGLRLALFSTPIDMSVAVTSGGFFLTFLSLSLQRTAPTGRREFLARSAIVLGGAALLLAFSVLEPTINVVRARRLFAFRPPAGLDVPGITEPVTPVPEFYVMDKVLDYPSLNPDRWRLTISGRVTHPFSVDLPSLIAQSRHHRYVTLECVDNPVGGPLIGNALWTGIPVSELLRASGATGASLVFQAADGYAETLPTPVVAHIDPLIACGMNGDTLSRAHGYPARLIVPGLYGFKSVKWLTDIRVTDTAPSGEWAAHGWDEMPQIHTTARIDVARRNGESVLLAGVAFAGLRGVQSVQVRVNDGRWREARLGRSLSHRSWVQWVTRIRWKGQCTAEVRAVDGWGRVQPGTRHGPYPAGATGWDTVVL